MERTEQTILSVDRIIDLPTLPSGSGLAISGATIWVAGDDSPYLFQLSSTYQVVEKQLMLPHFSGTDRIPKSSKPDFESMVEASWQGRSSLLIFGSGSKTPERDSLLVVPLAQPAQAQRFSLTQLYEAICQKEGIGRADLNIEGAVLSGETLWLLNRGRNTVITMPLPHFIETILENKPAARLQLSIHPFTLPQIRGKQARFSGACNVPGTKQVLLTATVEDTENWIDDGEILGSFVGLLDGNSLAQGVPLQHWLVSNAAGEAAREKLESIDVVEQSGKMLKLLAITDNDDGSSRLLELSLSPFTLSQRP